MFSLGLGGNVVGRDTSTTFPAAAHLPVVTPAGHDLSAEAVLALDPTVVLADDSIGPPEALRQLRAAGIPVVLVDAEQSLDAVPGHIRAIAAALGVGAAGERLVARVEGRSPPPGAGAPDGPAPRDRLPLSARHRRGLPDRRQGRRLRRDDRGGRREWTPAPRSAWRSSAR